MEKRSSHRLQYVLVAASVCFGLGVFGPAMTIVPRFGEFTHLMNFVKPGFSSPAKVSVLDGLRVMYEHGEYAVGILILVFSVLFPIWKLGALWDGVLRASNGDCPSGSLRFIEKLGKFSMLDVYVMALVAIAVKGLPGGSAVELNWALAPFSLSVLLAMYVTKELEGAVLSPIVES